MQMVKLKKILNPLVNKGIFQTIHELYPSIEWLTNDNAQSLDVTYYMMHSGDKYVSRFYLQLMDNEASGVIDSALNELAKILINFNGTNWNKIYEAYNKDYNPLSNYDMIEQENVSSKVKSSVTTGTSVYGFNNDVAVPSADVKNESITEGNKDDNERVLTRSGNIGVTTSQQMLKSELELRKYNFYNQVMNDIDKIMCLQVY